MQRRAISGLAVLLGLVLPNAWAVAEIGNVCVHDFQPGAACAANDLRLVRLEVVSVSESCGEGDPGWAEVVLRAEISAVGSPDRYDVGLFLALDGASALTGDMCFHGAMSPVTTTPAYGDYDADGNPDLLDGPWWNGDGDACGDIESNTQMFVTLEPLRIACADIGADGVVDVHAAVSWDVQVNANCSNSADAFPGTHSRCSNGFVSVMPLSVVSVDRDGGITRAPPRLAPNPFAGTTHLTYAVGASNSRVEIGVFDVAGRRIRTLVSGVQHTGSYTVSWDGTSEQGARVTGGIYWIHTTIGDQERRVSVVFLR